MRFCASCAFCASGDPESLGVSPSGVNTGPRLRIDWSCDVVCFFWGGGSQGDGNAGECYGWMEEGCVGGLQEEMYEVLGSGFIC